MAKGIDKGRSGHCCRRIGDNWINTSWAPEPTRSPTTTERNEDRRINQNLNRNLCYRTGRVCDGNALVIGSSGRCRIDENDSALGDTQTADHRQNREGQGSSSICCAKGATTGAATIGSDDAGIATGNHD